MVTGPVEAIFATLAAVAAARDDDAGDLAASELLDLGLAHDEVVLRQLAEITRLLAEAVVGLVGPAPLVDTLLAEAERCDAQRQLIAEVRG